VKKSHHQSTGTSSPKSRPRFSLIRHPFLVLAGTWVFFALLAAISLEILVHPTGERRVAVETNVSQTSSNQVINKDFDAPLGWYGAIALFCTGGSILVYRRYQRKFGWATGLQPSPTKARARNRRPQRQPQPSPILAQASHTTPITKTAPDPQKTRSRRRKPERMPVTADGYAPHPLPRQAVTGNISEVTVLPPPLTTSGKSKSPGLVEAMDLRNQKSLRSLLGDREIS
jgi:hypothetical protein